MSKLQAGTVISIIASLLFLAGCEQESVEEQPAGADLILRNGVIYTQDDINPQVEALAVTDGRITAIGTSDAISTQTGKNTKIVDLDGRFVMPGINDGHSHPAWGGVVALYYCLFPATASADEVAAKVKVVSGPQNDLFAAI